MMHHGSSILIVVSMHVISLSFQTATACNHTHSSSPVPSATQQSPCNCPRKTPKQLLNEYYGQISSSDCLSLSRIDVPIDESIWTSVYTLTSNTGCKVHHYDSQCYQPAQQCSWSHGWVDLGEDHFPRFLSNVTECRSSSSCNSSKNSVRNVKVLRRENRCDEGGEVWRPFPRDGGLVLTVACNCELHNS
jgi:hypothetical protein